MHFWHRRTVLGCGAGLAVFGGLSVRSGRLLAEPPLDVTFIEDFDELWRTLGERYCYLADKQTDWDRVHSMYRPMALAAGDDATFTGIVQRVLAELYDEHTHLSDPPDGSRRSYMYDIFAQRSGDAIRVAAVEDGSSAAEAGLRTGDRIVAIDGRPADAVVRDVMPRCLRKPDPAAEAYAVNVAVAGYRKKARLLSVSSGGAPARAVRLPVKTWPDVPNVESLTLAGGIGCIVIRSFADQAVADAFDKALSDLRDSPGLIIDVRDNGGGDTAVAKPIMGRFIRKRAAYAIMRRREGAGLSAPWTEYVDPKGPFTYSRPVVVLTSHWSGSMAEGFPMGMRDIGRATIVGTRMGGLGAAVFPIRLDRTGIDAQYSAEPVYDTQDRPRSRLVPDVEVPDGDDILAAGIREIRKRLHT